MPSVELLRKCFAYDPETGLLYWKLAPGNGSRRGDVAGSQRSDGYVRIMLCGTPIYAHVAAWAIYTGQHKPVGFNVDHVNGLRWDNKFDNLRLLTNSQNKLNSHKPYNSNTSGYPGVSLSNGMWQARISIDGRRKCLGTFRLFEDAKQARMRAELSLRVDCSHA